MESQNDSSQVIISEKNVVVSKGDSEEECVRKDTIVEPKTNGKEVSEKSDSLSERKEKIQPVYRSNRGEPAQVIPQASENSEPAEMSVSTETSDEKSKVAEERNEFWEELFKEKRGENKTKRSHTASKQKGKSDFVDIDRKGETGQDRLWQIFVAPERSSAKRFVIKKIDGTKKKPVKIQIEDLLRYRWFSCTESNYGWEWKFLPEKRLKSIAYVRYMDEDPAIYGAYECGKKVITVILGSRSCQYKPYYVNKWIPLVLYPIQTGQDRRYWWGNFFIPVED